MLFPSSSSLRSAYKESRDPRAQPLKRHWHSHADQQEEHCKRKEPRFHQSLHDTHTACYVCKQDCMEGLMAPRVVFFLRHSLKSHFDMGDISQDVPLHFPLGKDVKQTDALSSSLFLNLRTVQQAGNVKRPLCLCWCWCAALQPASSHLQVPATALFILPSLHCAPASYLSSRPHTINPPNPLARGSTYSRVAGADTQRIDLKEIAATRGTNHLRPRPNSISSRPTSRRRSIIRAAFAAFCLYFFF